MKLKSLIVRGLILLASVAIHEFTHVLQLLFIYNVQFSGISFAILPGSFPLGNMPDALCVVMASVDNPHIFQDELVAYSIQALFIFSSYFIMKYKLKPRKEINTGAIIS